MCDNIQGDGLNYDNPQTEPIYTNKQFDECVVYVYPSSSWEGKEFGFDWVRNGETSLPGDIKYYDHMGRYYNGTTDGKKNYEKNSGNYKKSGTNDKLSFEKDPKMYQNWIKDSFSVSYPVTWKRERYDTSDKHDENRKKAKFMYYVPIMTLMPRKTAELKLKVETAGRGTVNPSRIYLEIQDKSVVEILSISEGQEISSPERNKEYTCKIECKEYFFTDQFVDIIAEYSEEDKRLCGQLKILANSFFANTINVLCFNVETKINAVDTTTGAFDTDTENKPNETKLRDVLGQAMINVNMESFGTSGILEIDANRQYSYPLNFKVEGRTQLRLIDSADTVKKTYHETNNVLNICYWAFLEHYTEPIRQRIQPVLEKEIEDRYIADIAKIDALRINNQLTEVDYDKKKKEIEEDKKKSKDELHNILKNEMRKELDKNKEYTKYKNYYLVFFLGNKYEKSTFLPDGSKSTSNVKGSTSMKGRRMIIFSNHDRQTVAHEILHALQLEHTFAARIEEHNAITGKNDIHNSNAFFTYSAEQTDNIMDYPPINSTGDNATKYYNTWYWQWKVIWEEVRRHNINIINSLPIIENDTYA